MPPVNIADNVIAETALTTIVDMAGVMTTPDGEVPTASIVDAVLRATSKVRFQPSTRQLVLTFDLAFNTSEPDTSGPVQ